MLTRGSLIAVISADQSRRPLSLLTEPLTQAIAALSPVVLLTQGSVRDDRAENRLAAGLLNLAAGTYAVCECENDAESDWTRQCLQSADCILWVCFADVSSRVQHLPQFAKTGQRQELVLIHQRRETYLSTLEFADVAKVH